MKTPNLILILILILGAVAGAQTIVVDSLSSVRVGAKPAEDAVSIASTAKDEPARRSLLTALREYEAAILKRATDAEAKCAAIIAKLADPAATKEDANTEAAKTERQRQIDELTKQAAEIAAKLAELEAKAEGKAETRKK